MVKIRWRNDATNGASDYTEIVREEEDPSSEQLFGA